MILLCTMCIDPVRPHVSYIVNTGAYERWSYVSVKI